MTDEKLSMAELKNKALSLDRAEMWDLYGKKDAQEYLCKRHMLVWNVDKGIKACIAPKNYTVIQHRKAIESVVEAITSLNINAEAEFKISKHGIHVDFNFPDSKVELKEVGESFTSGIRLVNEYDEVSGLLIAPRLTRLACSNGMIVCEIVRARRIKYTEQLNVELEGIIDKIINDLISNDQKLTNMVSICMKDSIEWQTAQLLAKELFKSKKFVREILSRVKSNDDGRLNRWNFYNGITQFVTQAKGRLRPAMESWFQNKAQKVLTTPFNDLTEELVKIEKNE